MHNLRLTDGDLVLLIERFDKSRDGTVGFHEFTEEVSPHF